MNIPGSFSSRQAVRRNLVRYSASAAVSAYVPVLGGAALKGGSRGRRPGALGVPRARAIIRTMLKDVAPSELANKATLFHEHISSMGWQLPKPGYAYASSRPRNFREDIDYQVEEVRLAGLEGIACIVDGGHPDMGRDINFLQESSAPACRSSPAPASTRSRSTRKKSGR